MSPGEKTNYNKLKALEEQARNLETLPQEERSLYDRLKKLEISPHN